MVWTSYPVAKLSGRVRAPGDKSCSHRALIFSTVAAGESHVSGLLESEDVLNTLGACRALGATIEQTGPASYRIVGVGETGLQSPAQPLDFGNSGTGARLMMGVVSGYPIRAEFVGDESLSGRPMRRVLDPLGSMGARWTARDGKLPVTVEGGNLKAIDFVPPHASAQVKSALLLAGLNADGITQVREPKLTRDHTERMLRGYGAEVATVIEDGTHVVSIRGGQKLSAREVSVPGDPSSAAFLAAAALLSTKGEVLVEGVLSNETRDGLFTYLSGQGAEIGAEEAGEAAGERLIDMTFASSNLRGGNVPTRLVPAMIDEFPLLGVIAAFSTGKTVVTGAEELRVKESDRIGATVAMLRANGVSCEETPDGFVVEGCGGPPPGGGLVQTRHDHRIAMSALIMGTAAQKPVSVDDIAMIATSYPDFFAHMKALGADIRER